MIIFFVSLSETSNSVMFHFTTLCQLTHFVCHLGFIIAKEVFQIVYIDKTVGYYFFYILQLTVPTLLGVMSDATKGLCSRLNSTLPNKIF